MLKYGILKTKKGMKGEGKSGIRQLCAHGWHRWSSLSGSRSEEGRVGSWPPLEWRGLSEWMLLCV